jgi:hypothetical protein
MADTATDSETTESLPPPGSLTDLLQELRILLQGSQLMTGFLTILPFSSGFQAIEQSEKWVFLATFLCSIASLVLFSAPALHHRLERPLVHRERFKHFATRMAVIGMITLSISIVLATQLVVAEIISPTLSWGAAAAVAVLVGVVWWVLPLWRRSRDTGPMA